MLKLTMATHVTITSLRLADADAPDPHVLHAAKISATTRKGLNDGPLRIIASKDDTRFILENGAILNRVDDMVYYNDLWFKVDVELS